MQKVTFQFEQGGEVVAFAIEGEKVLDVARKANVAIDAPCSGNGSCGKCRVKLVSGKLESHPTRHISDDEYSEGWRLACESTIIDSDVVIEVPDIASAYQSRMKTADLSSPEEIEIFTKTREKIFSSGLKMKTAFSVMEVELNKPTVGDAMSDCERLARAVRDKAGVKDWIGYSYSALLELPETLRASDFHIKCVLERVANGYRVCVVKPYDTEIVPYGMAIDIGTTTVSAVIVDMLTGELKSKASSGNGQIRYGADIINRIIESTKEGGRERLKKAIVEETIVPIINHMCADINILPTDICRVVVASNTTMNHLFAGVPADSVRLEPYVPVFDWVRGIRATDLGLPVMSEANLIFAPNIGSYVGGDITAGTLSSMIWKEQGYSLFIDLGTNGEIVFGNSEFLMSCACSAGPAFEGGDISCGMRATDGAIESCTIDAETMKPTFHIIGDSGQKPVGLCGSGIIDVVEELYRCGIIDPSGKFIREGSRVHFDEVGMGRYVLAESHESETGKEISINEVDLDNFIRAKGAIFSAIKTMLKSLDFSVSAIDHVLVAGGIGSGINIENAIKIGMLPDISIEHYDYIGNSSLSGAYAMLLSHDAEWKVYELAQSMTYLELSTEPTYMDEFVAACFVPHTDKHLFPSSKVEY